MVADNDIRKSLRRTLVVVGCAAVVSLVVFLARSQSNETSAPEEKLAPQVKSDEKPAPQAEHQKLDYSKPVFTKDGVVVCSINLLFDRREDHSPSKIVDMFYSTSDRSERAQELGCEEWRGEIEVYASDLSEIGMAGIRLTRTGDSTLFTEEDELTNNVPGQSDADKAELAKAHINAVPATPLSASDNTSRGIGDTLVAMPSRQPILKGNVIAGDIEGFGAVLCPDSKTLALAFDSQSAPKSDGTAYSSAEDMAVLKRYGCSYVPPGTSMVSEGGNSIGSLAIVTAQLPDGSTVKGVTLPTMIATQR